MESKKINQLATELTPALSDLTIIGDPTTGISKKITLSQMASLFTGTVEEYPNLAAFPLVGVADTIYIALDTNVLYRWDTTLTSYVELSPNIINSLVFNDANGFDGTISLVGSVATLTITTALTQGSVGFIGASGALTQDNSNFYWDNTNKRLGINTNAPTTAIDAFGSGIIGRLNGTSTNNAYLGFASAGTNQWSIGNVQSDHRFRIYSEANTAELVSVLQTGEFGIDIANPTTKLHIDGGASALIANLDANVSVAKSISFRSDNSARINLEVSGTESGSNVGADLFIRRYTDAGALIDTPFTLVRSTGNSTFLNNVGIGIAPTSTAGITELAIGSSATNPRISGIRDGVNAFLIYSASTSTDIFERRNLDLRLGANNTSVLTIAASGTSTFSGVVNTTSIYRLTQASVARGGLYTYNQLLGSGTDYSVGIASEAEAFIATGGTSTKRLTIASNGNTSIAGDLALTPTDSAITFSSGAGRFFTGGAERLRIDSNGNIGIGVTPSAWGTSSIKALQIGTFGSLAWTGGVDINIFNNSYYDGTNFKYIASQEAARYLMNRNNHHWYIAPAGSAGNNITFTEVMRINSSGNVTVNENIRSYFGFVNFRGGTGRGGMYDYATISGSGTDYGNTIFAETGYNIYFCPNGSTTKRMTINTAGNIVFSGQVYGNTVGSPRTLYIQSDGEIGGISSIEKSKKNINSFDTDWLMKLKPVSFNYRKKDEEGNYTEEHYEELFYGLIAEETELVNKEICTYNEETLVGIEYSKLIIPLLKKVQEQQKEIEFLKSK